MDAFVYYYTAESATGHAGEIRLILSSDWLPEWANGIIRVGPARKRSLLCHKVNPLLTKLVWLR